MSQPRRSGRLSAPGSRVEPLPAPSRKSLGSMPTMPGLSLQEYTDPGAKLQDQDARDESKMAEILLKMQAAKQKSAEKKKRKNQQQHTLDVCNSFAKDNSGKLLAMKRKRVSTIKKVCGSIL